MNNNTNNERTERAASMRALYNDAGPVYIWAVDETKERITNLHRFSTEDDARKYIEFARAEMHAHGWKPAPYVIGTAEQYKQTAAKCDKQRRAGEARRYRKFVDEQNEMERAEIHALEALRKVCLQFDGKVINRRFFSVVDTEERKAGFWCHYNGAKETYCPAFSITSRQTYTAKNITPKLDFYSRVWPWLNTRLNASEAVELISGLIQARKDSIKEREATIKEFAAYTHKAAILAAQLAQILQGTNRQLVQWAAANVLGICNSDALAVLRGY